MATQPRTIIFQNFQFSYKILIFLLQISKNVRFQQKLEDLNIKGVITLIKKIDEMIVSLEQNLDLKNEFCKDVFEEEDYLCIESKITLKEN